MAFRPDPRSWLREQAALGRPGQPCTPQTVGASWGQTKPQDVALGDSCDAGAEGPREQPSVQEGSAELQVLETGVTPGKANVFAEQERVVSRKEHPPCPSAFTQPLPRLPATHMEGDPCSRRERCGDSGYTDLPLHCPPSSAVFRAMLL